MNTYGNSGSRQGAFEKAMALMQGNRFDVSKVGSSGAEQRLAALQKANAWTQQGLSAVNSTADAMTGMAANTASQGLQMAGDAAVQKEQLAAAKHEARQQNKNNWLGVAAQGIGLGIGLLACERRLKGDIHSMDPDLAWRAVRDVPYYSFRYRSNPGSLAYGPMVDEVELIDDSLVRSSLLPDDEVGPIRGFDVIRWQAYESVALGAALNRIEQLEQQVQRLTSAVERLRFDRALEAA